MSAGARAAVYLEHRFAVTPDGAVWTDGPFPASFFARYLDVFEAVRVAARARPVAEPDPGWRRADGSGVRFEALPYYVGPWRYFARLPAVRRAVARLAAEPGWTPILRAPSEIANLAAARLLARGRRFAAEVVGDPWDACAPGAVRHPLRALARRHHLWAQRRICRHASAAAYVTERALQQRYPPAPGAYATHYSSVELADEAFSPAPRTPRSGPLRLVAVGSMEHLSKAQDAAIEALARCRAEGLDARLTLVGDGRYRPSLEALTRSLGLASEVEFRGALAAGEPVRRALDEADVFVLPSRQEGLPRAMIEAMARGLPAIGSTAGGIGELLAPGDLTPPGDAEALARAIAAFAHPERRAAAAARNWRRAHDYRDSELRRRRVEFYRQAVRLCGNGG
jgi:glycosyltransferase involved in cell wall biosynthesis